MKFDVRAGGLDLRSAQELARDVSSSGLAGIVFTEAGRTAYLSCAAAALAAEVDIATGIAVAFARSPMVTAATAWELAEATGGRFRLGIGTQVRAHIERRYAAAFDAPGPRLRDYVLALRSIFSAFRGEAKLDHDGRFYKLSLLPAQWSPGPIDVPDPPIDIAAVNPWMLRMAGEIADGVHVHPLNTPTYLDQTVRPSIAAGATAAGRAPGDVHLIVPCFTAASDDERERQQWRDMARMQVAFYGSTPNYHFIFDQLGFEGTTARIRERQKAGDFAGMSAAISDDLLEHFVVSGTWEELPVRLADRYRDVDRVVLYFAGMAWQRDRTVLERWGAVADEAQRIASAPRP